MSEIQTPLKIPATPNLPIGPKAYEARYVDQLNNVLRLYFNQLNNMGTSIVAGGGPFAYIDLLKDAAYANETARLGWNATDQTVNIGMEYGVVQQVGQELYARVRNNTGATIPNGTVVGFAGAATDALLVEPYIANGTVPSLYILGVMTHDLPDSGEKGYCTTWGFVRNLDTSGFNVGDVLYASPSTAGAFTNIKPTAADNVIPVAACVVSDVENGVVFVRPTIEQTQYYGVFADTTTQSPDTVYTPKAISFNKVESSNGVLIGGTPSVGGWGVNGWSSGTWGSSSAPSSRIIVPDSGLYKFAFSAQVESSSSSSKKMWIWPRINGVDVPDSNTEITFSGSGTVLVPAWSWTLSMGKSDYFEIMYAADSTDVSIISKAAQTGADGTATFARPAVPGMLLEVTQVQQ